MKILGYSDDFNYFEAAVHMTVVRRNLERNGDTLIAAGIFDLDSVARGIVSRALRGDRLKLRNKRTHFHGDHIYTEKNNYRFIARPVGKLTHAILLHKSAVDEQLQPNASRILLVPDGGDIADLFLRRFAGDYNLPYVTKWKDAIWSACKKLELVQSLSVWTDPLINEWKGLTAFEVSPDLTEERAQEILSQLLAMSEIELPEGVTDAPTITEELTPDENGAYQVIDYLQIYAPHLATTIDDLATPAHDLDKPITPAIAQMERVPFPAQAHTVQAILDGYEYGKGIIAASDMGCGKSIISLAVASALANKAKNGFVSLLLVPGITIPKWIRDEIGRTLPNARVTVLDNWKNAIRYRNQRVMKRKKDEIEFILLSRDTAKLGMPKTLSLIYKKRMVLADRSGLDAPRKPFIKSERIEPGTADRANSVFEVEDAWVCPECFGIQKKTTKAALQNASKYDRETDRLSELKLGFSDLATDTKTYSVPGTRKRSRIQHIFRKSITDYCCSECGVNLMRDIVPERETVSGLKHRRLQPAWFIQKYMRGWFDLAIVDELHQYKSNSGQGEAMGAIVGASKRVLGLTGTLSDGKASSLYHLLWRISPAQMKADGLDHRSLNKFVHLYGTMEQRGRYSEDDIQDAGGSTTRKVILNPPKEVPGLSPKLFVNHLSDKVVFLELGDMGLPLVELVEKPVFIDMDEDHQSAYTGFHNELEATMRQQYAIGNKHAFAKFIPSVVNAANQPHVSREVLLGDDWVYYEAPNGAHELSAKERQILSDIQDELAQNRRCMVYVRYSGDAQQDTRIAEVLRQHGIRVQVLKASVSPEDRVEWLENVVDKGVDVVISNAKLVEVGLDLLFFPSLFFYQFTDEIATMRQAARRAWRIGQHRSCKVLYYVYNKTYEMVQFKRMLTKRSHALLLEGRLDRSEVSTYVEQDSKSASTFAIANCLGNIEDLSQKWKALADKDIPSGVAMLAEERFKTEVGQAMLRLALETRRLAGVPEPTVQRKPVLSVVTVQPHDVAVPAELPLFAFDDEPYTIQPDVIATPVVTPLTMADYRLQMGTVVKAKRVSKLDKVDDDQMLLFAL